MRLLGELPAHQKGARLESCVTCGSAALGGRDAALLGEQLLALAVELAVNGQTLVGCDLHRLPRRVCPVRRRAITGQPDRPDQRAITVDPERHTTIHPTGVRDSDVHVRLALAGALGAPNPRPDGRLGGGLLGQDSLERLTVRGARLRRRHRRTRHDESTGQHTADDRTT